MASPSPCPPATVTPFCAHLAVAATRERCACEREARSPSSLSWCRERVVHPQNTRREWSFHVSLLLSHGGQGGRCRFSVCRRKCTGDDLPYHRRRVAQQTSRGERVIKDSRHVCHFTKLFFYFGRLKIVLTVIGIREKIDSHKVKGDSERGGFSRCTWDKLGFARACGS